MKINLTLILTLMISTFSCAMEPNDNAYSIKSTSEWELLEAHLKDRLMRMHGRAMILPPDPEQALSFEENKLSPEKQVWLAVQKNCSTDLKRLLGNGKNQLATIKDHFGRTPLHIAASNFRHTLIPLLIAAGAEVNEKGNNWGATPLVNAVNCSWGRWADQNDTVLTLLAFDADPQIEDIQGRDALEIAHLYGSQRVFVPTLEAKMKSNS